MIDAGLLIARLVFGPLMAVHGSQKLFGWFAGPGLRGTAVFLEGLGFRPGRLFAVANALVESVGGVLLALGLLGPFAPAAIISAMIVAIATVHVGKGLLAPDGVELPLLYLTAALTLALAGSGRYSLDAALGLNGWWTPQLTAIVLAAGVVAGVALPLAITSEQLPSRLDDGGGRSPL